LLGSLFAGLDRWAETTAAFDDDLALNERLLQPAVANLLADSVRDLILIPASPAALLPWAATTVRWPGDSHPTPVRELLTLSVTPSAAAVFLGRQRMAGRVRDAAAGRLLVVADIERRNASPLPGARDEAHRIDAAFLGRVARRTSRTRGSP
jgi:hypothetical protein